jgi:hypothetical protein
MKYEGPDAKIDWTGTTEIIQAGEPPRMLVSLFIEDDKGRKWLALDAGKIVPDNWVGKRVRITVELLNVDVKKMKCGCPIK